MEMLTYAVVTAVAALLSVGRVVQLALASWGWTTRLVVLIIAVGVAAALPRLLGQL